MKQRLRSSLETTLQWRELQPWDAGQSPYPGLPAFEAHQAPVFFGRDGAIETVVERLAALALRPPAFLLLLGASGYGKSSLVRAGVVPRLQSDHARGWTVLPPFTPGEEPFAELEEAVIAAGGVFEPADPLRSLKQLRRRSKAPVVLVIDQFEELLAIGPRADAVADVEADAVAAGQPDVVSNAQVESLSDEGERFQGFLQALLRAPKAGFLVLATMRTDCLAPLQSRWPSLTGKARSMLHIGRPKSDR